MTKVGLIFPRFKYPSGDIPLGIAYIASSILKNTKAEVKVIDTTFYEGYEKVKKEFKNENFDIIGISLMTSMLKDAKKIIAIAKKYNPHTKIIIGGPHPTVMPEKTIKLDYVDAIVIGEGEEAIPEIINKKTFSNIEGVWYKKDGKIIRNKSREPIKNLDKIPFPAWDLFDVKKYQFFWFPLDSFSSNLKGMNIIISRGCPYRCSYCQPTLNKLFGKRTRRRSVENVIKELKELKIKYDIRAFMIEDDTFNLDKSWVEKFCERLIEEKLNLFWVCNTRVNLIDAELFSKMKKAGLRKVCIGIESGSQRILDEIYQKDITLEQVKKSVDILNQLKLKIQGYFMVGAPTETEQEINRTIKLAKNLDIHEATFSVTTPLPGTYLYNKTYKNIGEKLENFDYYKNYVYENQFSQKKINYFKRKAFLTFYLSGKRLKWTLKMFLTYKGLKKSIAKLKRF